MIEEFEKIRNEWAIKSVNGRDYKNGKLINFSFNCKYYNLKREVQDYFLTTGIQDETLYNIFDEDMKMFIEELCEKYKVNFDEKNSGFYGRSGGNYCISFFKNGMDYEIYEDSHTYDEIENYYYKPIKRMVKVVERDSGSVDQMLGLGKTVRTAGSILIVEAKPERRPRPLTGPYPAENVAVVLSHHQVLGLGRHSAPLPSPAGIGRQSVQGVLDPGFGR